MYSLIIAGQTVTCDSPQEVTTLIAHCGTIAGRQTTPAKPTPTATPPRATKGKGRYLPKKKPLYAQKKARAAKARASYAAKQEAKKQEAKRLIQSALTKKDAEEEAITTAKEVVTTTAETHHGAKEKRADTGGDIISVLRRSGLPLTIPEIRDDLQRSDWTYNGPDPKGTIRATLNRLVTKGEVAKGSSSDGALTFRIARVEHADPLPHQQRESDA